MSLLDFLLLLLLVNIHFLWVCRVSNLLNSKFDSPDLQDISFLDFIIHFFIVVLQTANDQVHIFIEILDGRTSLNPVNLLIAPICRLKVKSCIVMIHNLDQRLIFSIIRQLSNLVGERHCLIICAWLKLITVSHDNYLIVRSHCFFRQMSAFIIEKPVGVPRPSNTFHQNYMGSKTAWLVCACF